MSSRLRWIIWAGLAALLFAGMANSASLDSEASRALRKIGIGPEQSEAFSKEFDKFLRSRNMQVRRVLKNHTGGEVSVMARKRVRRAANKSVKQMRGVLSENQIKYYEEYLEKSNKIFLRDAGLK